MSDVKFCPFRDYSGNSSSPIKSICDEYCALYLNGKCSLTVIAEKISK